MLPLFPPNDDMIALLRACKDKPEDDAPRLIFADYLEDHGQGERGEFIRVQCALSQARAKKHPTEKLAAQESALYWQHVSDWLLPWRDGLRYEHRRFSRGLVALEMVARTFLSSVRRQPHLTRDFAWVEMVTVNDIDRTQVKPVAGYLAQLDELYSLTLAPTYYDAAHTNAALRVLWEASCVKCLRYLSLRPAHAMLSTGLTSFLESSHLEQLQTLHLSNTAIDVATARRLAQPTCLPALQAITLEACQLSNGVLVELESRFTEEKRPTSNYYIPNRRIYLTLNKLTPPEPASSSN